MFILAEARGFCRRLFFLRKCEAAAVAAHLFPDGVVGGLRRGPYMPTPIAIGDELYSLNNNGVLHSFDLEAGREHFMERIPHEGKGFSASPVAADGRIDLPAESGLVTTIAAGPTLRTLASNRIPDTIMATPAISDGVLYLRGARRLLHDARSTAAVARRPLRGPFALRFRLEH